MRCSREDITDLRPITGWTDGAGVIPPDVLNLLGQGTIDATITVANQLSIYPDGVVDEEAGQSVRPASGLQRVPRILVNHLGDPEAPAPDRADKYEGVAFSPSGNILAVAAAGANSILLFRRGSAGRFEKHPCQILRGGVQGLDFPHDVAFGKTKSGEVLASVERGGVISMWLLKSQTGDMTDAPTKRMYLNTPADHYVDAICFLPGDSPYLAAANHHTSTISFYKPRIKSHTELTATPEAIFFSPYMSGPEGIAFSECGCWLAVANHGNNTVAVFRRLYSAQAGSAPRYDPRPVTLIADPELKHPHSVAFSPVFNHLIVTNAADPRVHVFAASGHGEDRRCLSRSVSSLEFVPQEIFAPVNQEFDREGGAKGIATQGDEIAICSPEMGLKVHQFWQ